MISEAQWKVIKHNDLGMFNRPWLDLVVHVLITRLLPWVRVTLTTVLQTCRAGRAALPMDWQKEFQAQWIDMSKPDEQRNIEQQLTVLKSAKKSKGCAEKLAELEADAERPSGTYHTDIDRWTCSCPSYLISQFLLCKHIAHTVNARIPGFNPRDDLVSSSLHCNHLPLFYLGMVMFSQNRGSNLNAAEPDRGSVQGLCWGRTGPMVRLKVQSGQQF